MPRRTRKRNVPGNEGKDAQDENPATVIALYELYRLGGMTREVDVEDLAVASWLDAPHLFSMKKYRQYPRLDAVYYPLKNAKIRGLTSGGLALGWRLTEKGANWIAGRAEQVEKWLEQLGHSPSYWGPRGEWRRELERIAGTTAFRKFVANGTEAQVSRRELTEVLSTTYGSPPPIMRESLAKKQQIARDSGREDVRSFLDWCERLIDEQAGG